MNCSLMTIIVCYEWTKVNLIWSRDDSQPIRYKPMLSVELGCNGADTTQQTLNGSLTAYNSWIFTNLTWENIDPRSDIAKKLRINSILIFLNFFIYRKRKWIEEIPIDDENVNISSKITHCFYIRDRLSVWWPLICL